MSHEQQLPKYRLILKAKDFVAGKAQAESKKIEVLMTIVASDEAYWLWVNEALFDNLNWASEAAAAMLSKNEVLALRAHLEKHGLEHVKFDDPKGYHALMVDALENELERREAMLLALMKTLESSTACVLKFTKDGPLVSGYAHGIPLTCYFTTNGLAFVCYIERYGANQIYSEAQEIPVANEHIFKRVASSIEAEAAQVRKAEALQRFIEEFKERLANLSSYGKTALT